MALRGISGFLSLEQIWIILPHGEKEIFCFEVMAAIQKSKYWFKPNDIYFWTPTQNPDWANASVFWTHTRANDSIQFGHLVGSDSLQPHELQHARLPCPTPNPGVHSESRPLSQWCHLAISSSVVPFSSCPQSLPALQSFPVSQPFTWGGRSTGVSASASFPPKKSQGWSPSEWTGWISLQSKGLSRVCSNTTVQKHQFFDAQPSSQSNSHIHTWPLKKVIALTKWTLAKYCLCFCIYYLGWS